MVEIAIRKKTSSQTPTAKQNPQGYLYH